MSSKHTTLVMVPVALLLALLMSLLVAGRAEAQTASEASKASEVALQDAGQFTGPEWAWDSSGKPVDPIDEGYKAHYTANNPSGYGATEVTSADYTIVEIDWPGVEEWQEFSSADEASKVASDWASWYTNDDTCDPCADDVLVSTDAQARSHVAKLTEQGWYADPSDGCECMYSPDYKPAVSYKGMSDSEVVDTVNGLDSGTRQAMDSTGNLPEAPGGYQYTADLSLLPTLPATGGPTVSGQDKPATSNKPASPVYLSQHKPASKSGGKWAVVHVYHDQGTCVETYNDKKTAQKRVDTILSQGGHAALVTATPQLSAKQSRCASDPLAIV